MREERRSPSRCRNGVAGFPAPVDLQALSVALNPVFLNPLDDPLEPEAGQGTDLLKVQWKKEHEGWTCSRVVPDIGADICVCPEDMAPSYDIPP